MLLSHLHEFIFIKPQKTAGTSVELFLSKICGSDDIITPFIYDPNPNVRTDNGAKQPQNYKKYKDISKWNHKDIYSMIRKFQLPNNDFKEHLSAVQIRNLIDETIWKNYRKISMVRNPWDHAVSYYKWYKFRGHFTGNFHEFISKGYNLQKDFLFINQFYVIDEVIQFEFLEEDLEKLVENMNIKIQVELPTAKKNISRTNDSYRLYYDRVTKNIVTEKNAEIIEMFDYKF